MSLFPQGGDQCQKTFFCLEFNELETCLGKNDVSQLDAQLVDILCMSVICTHALYLCNTGMVAAFAGRFFSRMGHRRERNVQVSILT